MDAVFADPDGGFTVVDWKTGDAADGDGSPALAVQLAAYRLAWAALSGAPVGAGAGRVPLRAARTVPSRPVDLLDAAGLHALVESIPTGPG